MRWHWVVVLIVPPLSLAAAMVPLADWGGRQGAKLLDSAARAIARPPANAAPWVYLEPEALEATEQDLSAATVGAPGARSPARPTKVVPKKGIRVRAEAVLRLANAGARPSGIPVPAKGARPPGIALVGVSGLGIGLVDGDILTHADGRPARTAADVVGVVVGARSQHASEICGRFWRNGEPWNLIVEQPYVRSRRRTAQRTGS